MPPSDSEVRRRALPVLTYSVEQLPSFEAAFYNRARAELSEVAELTVPPRDAKAFEVPAGHFFRIVSVEGPQVGDLNLWNAHDLTERFYSGKTRALHATHLTTGDRLWSTFPTLRPMATITHDTLEWYGWDEDGAGVHDIIGTRCDPYTNLLLKGWRAPNNQRVAGCAISLRLPDDDVLDLLSRRMQARFQIRCAANHLPQSVRSRPSNSMLRSGRTTP